MVKAGHPTKQLIEIANKLALGSISMYQKDYSSAINHLEKAVIIQDNCHIRNHLFGITPQDKH